MRFIGSVDMSINSNSIMYNKAMKKKYISGDTRSCTVLVKSYIKPLCLFYAISSLVATPLQAAPVPDAGSILRDQQIKPQQLRDLPSVEAEKKRTTAIESDASVTVTAFRFSGHEGLATVAELHAVVAGSEGKRLSFTGLEAEAEKVTAYLKKKGWFLARAYLPKQDVTSGIIEIAITQGKSDGTLRIKRENTARISEENLRGFTRSAIEEGKPINEKELERSVLLLSDLPGISARAALAPGSKPGTSAVDLTVVEGLALTGSVWMDNQGNRYTGEWRGNTVLYINDPYGSGDQISILLTKASGLDQWRIGYTVPLGFNGVKGNLSYTGMRYELGADLASLQYRGQSNGLDASLTYPVIRSRNSNIITTISGSHKTLIDSKDGAEQHHKRSSSTTFNTSFDHYDTLIGGGYSSLNLAVTAGTLQEANELSVASAVDGPFARLNINASRLQRLSKAFNIILAIAAQLAENNLDSSEKFSLGGVNGVRAYPVSEASGDNGQLLNAELRFIPPFPSGWGSWQFIGFYDAGRVTLQKNQINLPGTATELNSYWLRGAGMGFSCTIGGSATIRGSWAHVIGDNPGRTTSGNNSDGRSDKSRFWLQALISF